MTPQLWGNPASHFGVQNDTVYGNLDHVSTGSRKLTSSSRPNTVQENPAVCEALRS
jgi:hypothetical protein